MFFKKSTRIPYLKIGLLCLVVSVCYAISNSSASVMSTPGLSNIVVWEKTGTTTPYNFTPNGTDITNQLGVGVLGPANYDFKSLPNEAYDVFYSDASGKFDLNGNYLTIEAIYINPASGGGLNVGAVDLIINNQICRADILASYLGLGPNYIPGTETFATDFDTPVPNTFTVMGSTKMPPSQHLRITVGWTKIPEPSSIALTSLAILTCIDATSIGRRRRRRATI